MLLLVTLAPVAGGMLRAEASAEKVELEVTFERPFPTLHEPVFVELHLRNDGSGVAVIDLGGNCENNISLIVTSPDGAKQYLKAVRPFEDSISLDCELSIEPGGAYRRKLLLNSWLASWPVGIYHVVVSITGILEASTNVQIEPRHPARLREVCENLERASLSVVADEAYFASKALGFAADEACLPSFKRALEVSSFRRTDAVLGLARLGDTKALAVLTESWGKLSATEHWLVVSALRANRRLEAFDADLAKAGLSREK